MHHDRAQNSKFLLSLLIVTIASGQKTCTPSTPITKGALGKLFEKLVSCYRPRSKNSVVAWRDVMVMEIKKGSPYLVCHRKIFFLYRKPGQVPYIVDVPSIEYSGNMELPNLDRDAQLKKWCTANQKKAVYWPSWTSRSKFIETVKFMVTEMVNIRNFQCDFIDSADESQKKKLDNSPIEGIIGYLYSVAYQYGFCID